MEHHIKRVWIVYNEEGYWVCLTKGEADAMKELFNEVGVMEA